MDDVYDEIAEAGAPAGQDEQFLLRIDAQGRLAASGAVHVFGANSARIDS